MAAIFFRPLQRRSQSVIYRNQTAFSGCLISADFILSIFWEALAVGGTTSRDCCTSKGRCCNGCLNRLRLGPGMDPPPTDCASTDATAVRTDCGWDPNPGLTHARLCMRCNGCENRLRLGLHGFAPGVLVRWAIAMAVWADRGWAHPIRIERITWRCCGYVACYYRICPASICGERGSAADV